MKTMKIFLRHHWATIALLTAMFLLSSSPARAIGSAKAFSTPEEAVKALAEAVNTTNRSAFYVIFGPEAEWLANPDTVQGAHDLAEFSAAFNLTNRLVRDSDKHMTLDVGTNDW